MINNKVLGIDESTTQCFKNEVEELINDLQKLKDIIRKEEYYKNGKMNGQKKRQKKYTIEIKENFQQMIKISCKDGTAF